MLADSGFQSVPFFRWLRRQGWHFVIRLTGTPCFKQPGHPWRRLAELERQAGQTRVLGWVRLTNAHPYGWLYAVAHWAAGQDEPWYLVTTQADARQALHLYNVRLWTEEM